ncbi:MAG: A/G-specific adenine glycosylase [Deltaproteobacteria bacterium]|nr:A/G-specific adenine glycosylase [Deltaproteobacteria bacterium]
MADTQQLRRLLLAHFDAHARDMPWRRTRDAYAIWVSEIMLQQTRVETVIPYYERFIERFPTPQALAEAHEDEVLAAWSGLGYYRRARLLHAGVREVVASYGGSVPEDAEARLALPGIGRYTAGAIGSIAFGKQEPLVDGNVARVLSRIFLIDSPLGRADTQRALWAKAEQLVRGERPGDLNQALMEHGATVCTPKSARCDECPLRQVCGAHAEGRVEELPVPRAKKAPREQHLVAVAATSGRGAQRCIWLVKSQQALFGGLFGLPTLDAAGDLRDDARCALKLAGISARLGPRRAKLTHLLSHRKLRLQLATATGASAEATGDLRLFALKELADVGVSSLTRRSLEALQLI